MSDKEETDQNPKIVEEPLDDAALEKLAVEELMREAARGAARAEIVGPSGWVKALHKPKTNKRFLANTIRNAISSNKYHSSRTHKKSYRKSPKRDRSEPTIKKDRSRSKH